MLYVIKEKCALILQTNDQKRYLDAVAHAATLWHKNTFFVQMPHTEKAVNWFACIEVKLSALSSFRTYYEPPKIKGGYVFLLCSAECGGFHLPREAVFCAVPRGDEKQAASLAGLGSYYPTIRTMAQTFLHPRRKEKHQAGTLYTCPRRYMALP